jgi:predicted nicotinamide N-methyase
LNDAEIEDFIRARLPVDGAPGLPEIRLHRASPTSGLMRLESDEPPYWAHGWGGGFALARHVLDHPDTVAGRRVLDLGAGSGLVAIAAALAGAQTVTAADVSPYAVAATRLNAELNGVIVDTILGDLTTGPPLDVEIVLAGDVFYAPELAERVAPFLDRCVAAGQTVLVGDPWRAPLPRERLSQLAAYAVRDFGGGGETPAAVFAWKRLD